jgi:folate-binding protein YgfZ
MTDTPDAADDLIGDLAAGYAALRGSGGWWLRARDVLVVSGPDAATYLQGQLSQDVVGLAEGTSAPSFLLQPDGKVTAWLRVTRTGPDDFVLDVEGGWGTAVAERLRRFLLRVKVEIVERPAADGGSVVAVRGSAAAAAALDALRPGPGVALAVAVPAEAGLAGFDVVLADGGSWRPPLPRVDPAVGEVVRIEAGVPAMGAELSDRTIPAEAGQAVIDASVSFTKGCYTGQELVARVDSRGNNVPRQVRSLVLAGADALPPTGAEVTVAGKVVGAITSAAWSPGRGAPVALALLARSVEVPAIVQVATPQGDRTATATALEVPDAGAAAPPPARAASVRFRS